jgi:D-alanyl-D-alanine carboxypeptidase (penicillin-binding protein 5/6)
VKPLPAGKILADAKVWFGTTDSVKAGLDHDLAITLPRGKKDGVEAVTRINPDLKAPIAKGQQVGEVVVTLGGETIATQPVVAMEAVEEAGFLVRIWHHLKRFLTSLF